MRLTDIISPINECLIVNMTINGNLVLLKNRDRAYIPKIKLVRELINDIEVVYIHDEDTDWSEGINEYGLALVNATLQGEADEKAKKKTKKDGKPSKDGFKVRTALGYKKLSEMIESVINFTGFSTGDGTRSGKPTGLNGHTFISSPTKTYAIEMSSDKPPIIRKLNPKNIDIRTNHGINYPELGYTNNDDDELSSKSRYGIAQKELQGVNDINTAFSRLANHYDKIPDKLSPYRRNFKLFTGSQMGMNMKNKSVHLKYDPKMSNFFGIEDRTPNDYQPKIKVFVSKVK